VKPEDLVVAATALSEFEAETKATVLRANGIDATVTRNSPSWTGYLAINPSEANASVLVRREDLQRAQSVLRQTIADSVDLDWDEVDVGQREDDLPLRAVGRMPVLAMISYAVAVAILFVSAILGLILILRP
jgi:hypothetical protein